MLIAIRTCGQKEKHTTFNEVHMKLCGIFIIATQRRRKQLNVTNIPYKNEPFVLSQTRHLIATPIRNFGNKASLK